jgi:hypothetical protein
MKFKRKYVIALYTMNGYRYLYTGVQDGKVEHFFNKKVAENRLKSLKKTCSLDTICIEEIEEL